jgi:hypothetical protein
MRTHVLALVFFAATAPGCARQPEAPAGDTLPARAEQQTGQAPAPSSGRLRERVGSLPLPEPVAPATASVPLSAKALSLRPETVELAILDRMGPAAGKIDVEVERGIVRLSGEVASKADFQRANYIARAIDGVIEVDQSRMRIQR